jgi:hypothetical protein
MFETPFPSCTGAQVKGMFEMLLSLPFKKNIFLTVEISFSPQT